MVIITLIIMIAMILILIVLLKMMMIMMLILITDFLQFSVPPINSLDQFALPYKVYVLVIQKTHDFTVIIN